MGRGRAGAGRRGEGWAGGGRGRGGEGRAGKEGGEGRREAQGVGPTSAPHKVQTPYTQMDF
jgi:hypothetical protein